MKFVKLYNTIFMYDLQSAWCLGIRMWFYMKDSTGPADKISLVKSLVLYIDKVSCLQLNLEKGLTKVQLWVLKGWDVN